MTDTPNKSNMTPSERQIAAGINNLKKNMGRLKGNPELAREINKKSVSVRRKNKEKLENLINISKNMTKAMAKEVHDVDTIATLKALALQQIQDGDVEVGSKILKDIAEFEKPKLTRAEVKQEVISYDGMSLDEMKILQMAAQAVDMYEAQVDPTVYLTNKGFQELAGKTKDELIKIVDALQKKAVK